MNIIFGMPHWIVLAFGKTDDFSLESTYVIYQLLTQFNEVLYFKYVLQIFKYINSWFFQFMVCMFFLSQNI